MKFEVHIVDDDKTTIFINKHVILKSRFHTEPLAFTNANDTLDFILNNNEIENAYCILLDINMPLMNGWEFLDALNKHKIVAQVLVVMVTSSIDTADKERAKSYPQVIEFLEKPINANKIEELKKHEALKKYF